MKKKQRKDKVKTPVLDFLLVLVPVLGVLIAIMMLKSEGYGVEEEVKDWREFTFSIDDVELSLPTSLEEIGNLGYKFSNANVNSEVVLDSEGRLIEADDGFYTVRKYDYDKDFQILVSDGMVYGVNITSSGNANFNMSGISWGSSIDDVKAVWGNPSDSDSLEGMEFLLYSRGQGSYVELRFNNGGLSSIKVINSEV